MIKNNDTNTTGNKSSQVVALRKRAKVRGAVSVLLQHLLLAFLVVVWLVPIVWLLVTSFGIEKGINISTFFPKEYTFKWYQKLFTPDTVVQFPSWFMNTLVIAIFTCIISSLFVLMVAYATSCLRFKGRKALMNMSVIMNLFPGFLSMIAVYFILKSFNLTNSHIGLILVYSGSSGLGYLVAKGFFDTVPTALSEAAKVEGATKFQVFYKVVLPLSKPIIVYTIINSFLMPWMDFVFAKLILNSGISSDWTVSIGLYNMLDRVLINNYFAEFCAGGVLVAIPISVLFIIMQKFYVEGITGGSVKG